MNIDIYKRVTMDDIFEDRLSILENNTDNFIDWLYSLIKPHIKGDIIEVSSGVGTYSKKLIKDFPNNKIVLTEISETLLKHLQLLKKKNVSLYKLDLNNLQDFENIGYDKMDTIVCSNVLEHIEKDEFALSQFFNLLKNNGRLLLLVPNNPSLYGKADEKLGHYRRYTKDEIIDKATKAGFCVKHIQNFNVIGTLGWRITKTTKKSKHNTKLLCLYNVIIPFVKFFDNLLSSKFSGLSLFIVLEKLDSKNT